MIQFTREFWSNFLDVMTNPVLDFVVLAVVAGVELFFATSKQDLLFGLLIGAAIGINTATVMLRAARNRT